MARYYYRPDLVGTLCPVCRIGTIKHASARTCSRICGGLNRKDRATQLATVQKALSVRLERYKARVIDSLREELAPLRAIVGPKAFATVVMPSALKIWSKAYHGGHCAYRNRLKWDAKKRVRGAA